MQLPQRVMRCVICVRGTWAPKAEAHSQVALTIYLEVKDGFSLGQSDWGM